MGFFIIQPLFTIRRNAMALKVFDLQCDHGHLFEGWFASHEDYDRQQQRGLLSCPLCQSASIARRPSAARLNLGQSAPADSGQTVPAEKTNHSTNVATVPTEVAKLQALWLRRLREVVHAAQDVGPRFSEEARRMHAGETQERAIRGTATPQEREALAADGIAVMPVPDFLDDDRLQ